MPTDTDHDQVDFITLNNRRVQVDVGMLDVLVELRRLGVRTQYSCEGTDTPFSAYVLADRRSFTPLLRKMRRNYGSYSSDSRSVYRAFQDGYHQRQFSIFRESDMLLRWTMCFEKGTKWPEEFCIERTFSNAHGARITLRWPSDETPRVLQLFKETS